MSRYVEFPNSVAPVHEGVYQRLNASRMWFYAAWRGGQWRVAAFSVNRAKTEDRCSAIQSSDSLDGFSAWRGLAVKP